MEAFYGISGMGAVLHTVNPRLFREQVEYIVNHAEDQYLFFDIGFISMRSLNVRCVFAIKMKVRIMAPDRASKL